VRPTQATKSALSLRRRSRRSLWYGEASSNKPSHFTTDNMCNPSIAKLEESTMFKICRANHNVRKATHAILDDAAQLKARVDRLCAQAGLRI
jgi:hypothetical protein